MLISSITDVYKILNTQNKNLTFLNIKFIIDFTPMPVLEILVDQLSSAMSPNSRHFANEIYENCLESGKISKVDLTLSNLSKLWH